MAAVVGAAALDCFASLAMTVMSGVGCERTTSHGSWMKQPAVYIMASGRNGTLYTGVTSNLAGRVHQHRTGATGGFTSRYRCTLLVFYEVHADMTAAITREKQIKAGSRRTKLALIEGMNPGWADLYEGIL